MDLSLLNLPEKGQYVTTKVFEKLCLGYAMPDIDGMLKDLSAIETIYSYYLEKDWQSRYNRVVCNTLERNIWSYSRELNSNDAMIVNYIHIFSSTNKILTADEIKTFLLKKKMLGYLKDYVVMNYLNLYSREEIWNLIQERYSFKLVKEHITKSLQRIKNEVVTFVNYGNWVDFDKRVDDLQQFMTRTNKRIYLYVVPEEAVKNKSAMLYYVSAKADNEEDLLNMYLNYFYYKRVNGFEHTQFKQVNRKDLKGNKIIVL